jgi:hypothetical protein
MKEIFRTTDAVLLSFAQHVLREEEIACVVLDSHMSIMEGSIGALPRRLMVADDDVQAARTALIEAGCSVP